MSTRGSAGAGVVMLLAGCVSIPEYYGPDNVASVFIEEDGINLAVSTSAYRMEFGTAGWRMPESLRWNGDETMTELLGYNFGLGNQTGEDAIGIAIYNTYSVTSAQQPTTGGGMRNVLSRGPGRVAIEVKWDGPGWCGTGTSLGNTTRFTFYPDGRIVRHDVINSSAGTCTGMVITSFDSFNWAALPNASWGLPPPVLGGMRMFSAGELQVTHSNEPANGWMCIDDGVTFSIGSTWWPTNAEPWQGVRFNLGTFPTASSINAGMVYDFVNGTTTEGQYIADKALFIRENGICDSLPELAQSYQSPPQVMGAAYRPADGTYFVPQPASLIATTTLLPGFVVALPTRERMEIELVSTVAERSRVLVDWLDYIPQLEPGDGISTTDLQIFYFTIEVQGGEQLILRAR